MIEKVISRVVVPNKTVETLNKAVENKDINLFVTTFVDMLATIETESEGMVETFDDMRLDCPLEVFIVNERHNGSVSGLNKNILTEDDNEICFKTDTMIDFLKEFGGIFRYKGSIYKAGVCYDDISTCYYKPYIKLMISEKNITNLD